MINVTIRTATENDLDIIALLFYETIITIGAKDYSAEQIKLWSTRDKVFWTRKFKEQHFIVAENENQIVGFSSLTDSGYVDFLYVHKDHQRKGIAKKLLAVVENYGVDIGLCEIHSHVSVTAKDFFATHGFVLAKHQRKKLSDVEFNNFAMQKELKGCKT